MFWSTFVIMAAMRCSLSIFFGSSWSCSGMMDLRFFDL